MNRIQTKCEFSIIYNNMNDITQELLNALELEDYDFINDFLIDISRNLNIDDLKFIDLLLDYQYQNLWKNYAINLVFYLGELGNKYLLSKLYIMIMKKIYFQSDRWVRNEILTSILKFKNKNEAEKDILFIINNALSDEYNPIKLNSLKVLNCLDFIPEEIMLKIFLTLPIDNSEIITTSFDVIKKNIHSNISLIKILKKMTEIKSNLELSLIRNILTHLFQSVLDLEQFRKELLNSDLPEEIKQKILVEIKIMQQILLQNLYD